MQRELSKDVLPEVLSEYIYMCVCMCVCVCLCVYVYVHIYAIHPQSPPVMYIILYFPITCLMVDMMVAI